MNKFGIDISKWQGDFDVASSGAEFVIIKAGGSEDPGGRYMDSQFLNNYSKAKNAGLPVGLYWYCGADSTALLHDDIDYLCTRIDGLQFELPIFLDIEESYLCTNAGMLAQYWCDEMIRRDYYPGIYSSWSWWHDTTLKQLELSPSQKWLAFWTDETPAYNCGIWQNGHVMINGLEVDSNRMFINYDFIRSAGYNGFMEKQYFSDVTADKSYYKAVQWAAQKGYVKGYKDGKFKPDEPVTRAQLCVILWRMAGRPE